MVRRHMLNATILVLGALLTSCAATMQTATVREHGRDGRSSTAIEIAQLPRTYPELSHLRDAALLSAAVYADVPVTTPLSENGPDSLAGFLPSSWHEDTDIPRPFVAGSRQTPDLTYRLWVDTDSHLALLVFRGTHIPADWISNLRWIDFWYPIEDHYEQTERITPKIVEVIRGRYGASTKIMAAGHSLGGGLAQTAAYAACGDIATVFAFDSSPVTKHRAANHCRDGGTPKNFYRVFEQSEILSYARFFVRLALGLRETDPHIAEVKVHLFEGVGVRAHSMRDLASRLDAALGPAKTAESR